MVEAIPPRLMARKEAQTAEVSSQDMVVAHRQEVKILLMAQR